MNVRLSVVETWDDGTVLVKQGTEAKGEGKDASAEKGTFENMLDWDPNYKGFVSPASLGHVIGPAGAQQANQAPRSGGAFVIPENSFFASTIGSIYIIYVWGYSASGVKVFMKVPMDGDVVDPTKVEIYVGTGG